MPGNGDTEIRVTSLLDDLLCLLSYLGHKPPWYLEYWCRYPYVDGVMVHRDGDTAGPACS